MKRVLDDYLGFVVGVPMAVAGIILVANHFYGYLPVCVAAGSMIGSNWAFLLSRNELRRRYR